MLLRRRLQLLEKPKHVGIFSKQGRDNAINEADLLLVELE
jgi:hypothetical protein